MAFWIINKIIAAYIISTLTFLIIILFSKTVRRRTNIFLNKANLIIIFVLVLNIIWVSEETMKCIASESQKNCFSIFKGTFLFAFLFQSLFFFNRHRTKRSLTFISIFLLTFLYNYERVVIFITSMYRDYIPSSWSTYYDATGLLWTIAFSILYFVLCWKNKLKFKNKETARI